MPAVTTTKAALQLSMQQIERATMSLQQKATWLRQHRSADATQQMQTDTIVELVDAVRQLQQALAAVPPLIPDVSAVRDAASAAATQAALTTKISGFSR